MSKKKGNKQVIQGILDISRNIYNKILKKKTPEISSPLRSLTNVKYDEKVGYFELLGKEKLRSLSASTVKSFAQTLLMMKESKNLISSLL